MELLLALVKLTIPILYGESNGKYGGAAYFISSDPNNQEFTLEADNNGLGVAAYIRNENIQNSQPVLRCEQIGLGYAGYFETNSLTNNKPTIYAKTFGTGNAAQFDGNVQINGNLNISGSISKSSGTFVIDDPLDPENKILSHSFVESPDMMNIYKGHAKLAKGKVEINLPQYFDALNSPDGREISLTPINGWSPLYVQGKIENNKFVVKTTREGNQDQEFSWIIYAVRNDPYARKHRVIPEQEKGVGNKYKRGEYINPDLYK